jgi:hypothetical protein
MQRGHPEVAKQFSLTFSGKNTKVGMMDFEVSEHSISVATKIPNYGEKWFKAMSLSSFFSKEFLKPEYQGDNLSKGVPAVKPHHQTVKGCSKCCQHFPAK